MYRYYNANSKGYDVNDCVIRAISRAEGKSWDETYIELSDIARRNGILLDDVNFVEPLLDYRYDRRCYDNGYTVGRFARTHPVGTYLVTMDGHITCIKNGVILDTFDCSSRRIKCVWIVK